MRDVSSDKIDKNLLFGSVLVLMLVFLPSAVGQKTSILSVNRSDVVGAVSERAKQSPALSPVELAAYGNELIAKKGRVADKTYHLKFTAPCT